MGFYGNITNTSRTQFQFDKIYASRAEMDQMASSDGIYAGRYVLVNYEQNAWDYYLNAYKAINDDYPGDNSNQQFRFFASYGTEQLTRFKWVGTAYEADPDKNVVYEGQTIAIPPDGMHNIVNPESAVWEFWKVNGYVEVEEVNEAVPDPELTQEEDPTVVTVKYACFTQYQDPFSVNYNEDMDIYGTSRGYDSTVWQKTYQGGEDKYVMVAELNTIVPTFDIEADAPKMVPLTPHFDADSTNVYYKLHWSPTWGLRVRAASTKLRGPILNDSGADSGAGMTPMTTDTVDYPSDETTGWYKTVYDGVNTISEYVFTVDDEHQWGRWIPKDEANRMLNTAGEPEAVAEPPAAIYYNKDGFKPETVSYSYFIKELDETTYKPYVYYKKVNGVYTLVDDLEFDSNLDYYEKLEDHIRIEPTGISGHMYNRHDGSITDAVQEDTQEISIMLPALGNTIAAIWDIIYGSEEVNDGERRNMDIAWERARAGMDRHGLRLVNDYDFGGQYLYKTKSVETVAGALNSVYDLLGMIITSGSNEDLMNNINELSDTRIYYDQTNHTFNRKHLIYDYTPLDDTSYEFEEITTLTAEGYKPGYYYNYDELNDEYVVDHDAEFDPTKTYYLRAITEETEYNEVSGFTLFDGMTYCYPDFVGTDDYLYTYQEVNLNADTYEPGYYYTYYRSEYMLDNSLQFDSEKTYYERTSIFNPLKMDYVRDPKYHRDKTYYLWNEIQATEHPALSDVYEKNKFFYKDGQGNYILSQSDKAETAIQYYTFLPENTRTLKSLFMEGTYFGIYVPGKYLYQTTDGDFRLAIQPTLQGSLTNERPVGNVYYILDTSNQTTLDNKVYNRVINYQEANLIDSHGVNYYVKDTYYLLKDGAPVGSNLDSDYRLCTDPYYDPNKEPYYIRNETLYLVNNNYYQVDESKQFTLIQFHENEFYYKDGYDYKVISRLADTAILTNEDIIVLRNTPGRQQGEPNGGTYILNPIDHNRPNIAAMIYQDQFYEAGKFHYLANDLFDGYTDYILDTYPRKTHDTYYKLTEVGDPVDLKFFEAYRYFEKNESTGQYTLITDDSVLPEGTIYERDALYVMHDEAGIYTDGAVWNFDAHHIPATLTLGRRTEHFGLEPFQDFARNLGTLHGMLLKIKGMLEYDDPDTRDTRTVQGALHTLQDKIAQFSTWTPGQVMIADDYGRLHGARRDETTWTRINVDPQVGVPSINIEHKYNPIPNTSSITDLSINDSASFDDIKTIRDAMGHEVATHTTTINFPHSYGIVGADNTTFTPSNSANVNDIPADGTYHAIKFEGTDQWVQTATAIELENEGTANEVSVKKIKFTHEYNRDTSRDTTPTVNLSTNSDAKITDVTPEIDAMGHVVAWKTRTTDLPDSYGIVGADNTTFTPNNANNINDISADTTYEAIKFEGTDQWINTATATETEGEGANAVSVKKIKFTHEYNRDTSRDLTTTVNLATSTTAAFTDWKPLIDANGHVVAWENSPITFPNSYSQFTGDSGSVQAADTYDSFLFEGSTWIQTAVDGTNQKATFTHKDPVVSGATARGETAAQTPNYGETFKVPSFSIDSKGHIAVSADHTVTIPNLALTSGTTPVVNNVVTSLTYNNAGGFTKTESTPASLLLTGYSASNVTLADITASDTIGSALNMLEKRAKNAKSAADTAQSSADTANNAIAAMDLAAVEADTGEVIGSVSQLNGQLSAVVKTLTVEDIPDIQEKEFEYTPTGESTAQTFTLQDIVQRLIDLETLVEELNNGE